MPSKVIDALAASGFRATIYVNPLRNEVVVVFPGSVSATDTGSRNYLNDWLFTNAAELAGSPSAEYSAASAFAEFVHSYYPVATNFTFVGFSKGGGEASYAAGSSDMAVTFDAARNPDADAYGAGRQVNVVVPDDIVGDPASAFGKGQLPGAYVYVPTTEPSVLPNILGLGGELSKLPLVTATHSMDGILGGLFSAAGDHL